VKPVVVAWALLFVVAVGVLYRFGSWIGRRRRRSPRHSTKAEESDETPPDPKTTETPPVVVARAPETAVASTRPATPSIAAAQARVASAPEVRQPTATSTAAAKPPPLPPVTSKVSANVRPSTNHATTAPAKVLRPSVSATLQPPEPAQPVAGSGAATMSPRLGAAAVAALAARAQTSQIRPDVQATMSPGAVTRATPTDQPPPAISEPPFNAPQTDVFETRLPAGFTRRESSSRTKVLSAPAKHRSTPLRARKVGAGAPTVGLRIKQARVRKLSGVSDVQRKPGSAGASRKRLKTPSQTAIGMLFMRRIIRNAEDGNLFASTKAATRIVGVPRRGTRFHISAER
jgi:hypothetical protein